MPPTLPIHIHLVTRCGDDASCLLLDVHSDEEEASKVVLVVSLGSRDIGVIADTVCEITLAHPDDLRPSPNGQRKGETSVSKLVKLGDQLIAANLLQVYP